jgi:hypothetical protein
LANVNVTLQYAGRDGVFGNADDPAAITVTTDTDGNYLFTELFLGNYTITVDQSDLCLQECRSPMKLTTPRLALQ